MTKRKLGATFFIAKGLKRLSVTIATCVIILDFLAFRNLGMMTSYNSFYSNGWNIFGIDLADNDME